MVAGMQTDPPGHPLGVPRTPPDRPGHPLGVPRTPPDRPGHPLGVPRTPPADPRQMRQAMADFVAAVHQAYLAQARLLPPAEQARLPLLATARLTVAAAGARCT
jgi:hypothetical protein